MSPRQFTYDAKNLYDVTINFANLACQWICIVSFIDLGWLDRTCMAIVKSIMTTNFVVFQVTHDMTLLISMTTLCGTDNILHNILGSYPHLDSGIHIECEKFLVIFWKLLVVPRNIVPNMSNVMAKPLVNLDLLLLYYHELNPRSRLPIWLQVIKNLWFLFFFFFFFSLFDTNWKFVIKNLWRCSWCAFCLPWFAHQKVIDKYGKCNKSGPEIRNLCISNGPPPPPSCPQNNGNTSLEFTHLKVGNAIGGPPSEVSKLHYNIDNFIYKYKFLCWYIRMKYW